MTSMYDHPPKTPPAAPAPELLYAAPTSDPSTQLGRAVRLADLGARLFASIDECYDRHRRGLMNRLELVDRIEEAAAAYRRGQRAEAARQD